MNRPAQTIAVVMFSVVLASGCAVPSSGTPVPAAVASTTGSGLAPVRPKELRLDGKDPCSLLPKSDWPSFYIERPGKFFANDGLFKSPECFYSAPMAGFDIVLVMTEGIHAWDKGNRSAEPKSMAPIHGYPTISLAASSDVQDQCNVAVDVAAGQYVLTSAAVDPSQRPKVPEQCTWAHELAESIMNTLVAQG